MLLWEIFSYGYMPYHGRSNIEVMDLVTDGGQLDRPEGCPEAIHQMMVDCWVHDPEKRTNFQLVVDNLKTCLMVR